MKPASPGLKLTYDDFVLFPDDGKRHELIDVVEPDMTTSLLPGLELPLARIFRE